MPPSYNVARIKLRSWLTSSLTGETFPRVDVRSSSDQGHPVQLDLRGRVCVTETSGSEPLLTQYRPFRCHDAVPATPPPARLRLAELSDRRACLQAQHFDFRV